MKLKAVSYYNGRAHSDDSRMEGEFRTKKENGSVQGEGEGEFSLIFIEGKFLIFETKTENPELIAYVFNEDTYHIQMALAILKKENLSFVGGGYVRWRLNECMKSFTEEEKNSLDFWKDFYKKVQPISNFHSESCKDHFRYDRPKDQEKCNALIEELDRLISEVRDNSFKE